MPVRPQVRTPFDVVGNVIGGTGARDWSKASSPTNIDVKSWFSYVHGSPDVELARSKSLFIIVPYHPTLQTYCKMETNKQNGFLSVKIFIKILSQLCGVLI